MSESNSGPFRSFRILWLPFSIPATVLGMAAWLNFYLVNWLLAKLFNAVEDTGHAIDMFARNVVSMVMTFELATVEAGSGWLFLVQMIVTLALWATFGLAICRCLSLRLTRDEYIGAGEGMRFGVQHARAAILFPVIIGACIGVLVAINAVFGTLMQIPWLGILFYPLLPLSFLLGGLMLVIGLTGVWGIGMVSAAISVERRGTLDAWGKTLNYVFARPIQFIVYLVVLKVFIFDIVVHYTLDRMIVHEWTATALSPLWTNETFDAITHMRGGLEGWDAFCGWVYRAIGLGVTLFLIGFTLNLAFAAFCCMFLIFRRDVDGIDVSDIEIDLPTDEPPPVAVAPAAAEPPAEEPKVEKTPAPAEEPPAKPAPEEAPGADSKPEDPPMA